MVYFTRKAGEKIKLSGDIDIKSSFIFRDKNPEEYMPIIFSIAGKPQNIKYTVQSRKWLELTDEVNLKKAVLGLGQNDIES